MRKMNMLCSLLGHRRDKRRVRPVNGAWRSDCVRCEASLERTDSGKWKAIASRELALSGHPNPRFLVDPFSRRPSTNVATIDRSAQPEQRTQLPNQVVTTVSPQPRAVNDRRAAYLRRAEEARLLAEMAAEQHAKIIHLEMAAQYYTLANLHAGQPSRMSAIALHAAPR